MSLMKAGGVVNTEEFKVEETQEENVRDLLSKLQPEDVVVFTDGSAFENPGPTGADGVVHLDGYEVAPVLLKKGVSQYNNNYTGELVGVQISLEFPADVSEVVNKNIHVFTDCQAAIVSAFQNQIPTNKIEIVTSLKQHITQIGEKRNKRHVHWVPAHKDIFGNELADQQAKAGTEEMVSAKDTVVITMDKREAIAEIKRQIGEKWKLKFENSQKVDRLQETFDEVGKRVCHGEKHRASFFQRLIRFYIFYTFKA